MTTFLPQNQFNSAAPVADEAAALGPPPPSDAAANLHEPAPPVPPGPKLPADALVSAGLSDDCIPEIFRVANLLCEDARIFVPDYPSIYQAMLDPTAPRALETDPVWADDAPLFLTSQG